MTRQKKHRDKLAALFDTIEENILHAQDAEIIEDVALDGRDPEQAAADVKSLITQTNKAYKKKKLRAAQEGYECAVTKRARRL